MNCLFFYLVSITNTSITMQIKQDSAIYYNGERYIKEPIVHFNGKTYVTPTSYIHVQTNFKVVIGRMGKHHPVKYKIKREIIKCY